MKLRTSWFFLLILLVAFGLPLATLAADKGGDTAEDKDSKKNITTAMVTATPIAVHDAALQALAGVGCEIKKDTADLIEGKRPNKIGLAVGSGGEKLFVTIKDAGNGRTEFKVTTKKTLLGIAGQKRWNDEVAAKIVEIVK